MLFVMDPIESINIKKDTTFVIMLEAQKRGHEVSYCELKNLFIQDGMGHTESTNVKLKRADNYFTAGKISVQMLDDFDVIWMRKDPPFNMDYIYSTYILSLVDESSTHVINHPKVSGNQMRRFIAFILVISPLLLLLPRILSNLMI